jgi:hypothetical protein
MFKFIAGFIAGGVALYLASEKKEEITQGFHDKCNELKKTADDIRDWWNEKDAADEAEAETVRP